MDEARPLRVALPTSTFLPSTGGVEVGLHNIARRLLGAGHAPVVIASAPQVRALQQEGWRLPYPVLAFPPRIWGVLRRWPGGGYWLLERFFDRLQRRHRFDFWHGTMGYPVGVALARWAARGAGVPHLVRCAGEDIQQQPEIGYGLRLDPAIDAQVIRWLPRAQRLVAITDSVAAEYRALGVAEARIARVPNGVDLERFARPVERAAVRRRWGIPPGALLFLAVGRNHPKKDFPTLVRAAGLLKAAGGIAFRVVLVGQGMTALASLIGSLGLEEEVLTVPDLGAAVRGEGILELPPAELVDLYRAADLFVFPSLVETFGIVLVEAMAAGLPVITTDAPGCRDVVRGGRDGVLVPPGRPEALARAMGDLARDERLRAHWADRSRHRAADFSWDRVVEEYVGLYRRGMAEYDSAHFGAG
ncbi:MAG: glycosyltransferase family 4 protein [Magnetococcales bacterium]|nr:glycosyltransferase family 4 protein [Magnetococcales bacterium]